MVSVARCQEFLESFPQQMSVARGARESRIIQSVVFPLKYGMSTEGDGKGDRDERPLYGSSP